MLGVALARSIADYLCLLAAVAAVTPTPNPALVLLAFVAAAVLRMLPLTPGGLGPVEAALIPLLAAAGLEKSGAVLATLAYRMASLWLPLLVRDPRGVVAAPARRRRESEGRGRRRADSGRD